MEPLVSTIWSEDSVIQKEMKSIWTVSEDDLKGQPVGQKVRKASTKLMFPGPAMFQEAAKGGRLYMDEVYNQMEELEMERRSNEGELGLGPIQFQPLNRGQFDWSGLAGMLHDARSQFGLLKNFIKTVEGMRKESETNATGLSPIDRQAKIYELLLDNKKQADMMRKHIDEVLRNLYESWEFKMAAIQRVLFPDGSAPVSKEAVKLDVMPYLLKELSDVIRISRIALFTVFKRYEEVRKRVIRKANCGKNEFAKN